MHNKKNNKFYSAFYEYKDLDDCEDEGEKIDTRDIDRVHCLVRCAIKIESIFVGGQYITLQVKLHEANVKRLESAPKRLLQEPTVELEEDEYVSPSPSLHSPTLVRRVIFDRSRVRKHDDNDSSYPPIRRKIVRRKRKE